MYSILLALLMIGIGVGAYRRARQEGTWSWLDFAITLAGGALLLCLDMRWASFLRARLGSERAGLATVLIITPLFLGIIFLTVYLSARKRQNAARKPYRR